MRNATVLLGALLLMMPAWTAGAASVAPGVYERQSDKRSPGEITVKKAGSGYAVRINTVYIASNSDGAVNTCDIEGNAVLRGEVLLLKADDLPVIRITVNGDALFIDDAVEPAIAGYCGQRTSIWGSYRKR